MIISHDNPAEQARIHDLLDLVPAGARNVLDVGSRDGYITRRVAQRCPDVTALDLTLPQIDAPGIRCIQGNAANLPFDDASFDLVMCAEVLEHIPSPTLEAAAREMARVTRRHLLIGVPFEQDIRHGRTRCQSCKGNNPPWGHVNAFTQARLCGLFPGFTVAQARFIGQAEPGTNAVSAWLMDLAGHPYGTYGQDEPCVHCGAALAPPSRRSVTQRILTKMAVWVRAVHVPFMVKRPNWIHVLLSKSAP